MALVLERKQGESIEFGFGEMIDGRMVITEILGRVIVGEMGSKNVRLVFEAVPEMRFRRSELAQSEAELARKREFQVA